MKPRSELRIDWVAPPFAGHLFPLLALASGLAARGFTRQRVLSTAGARASAEGLCLEFVPLLGERASEVFAIANTASRVSGAPHRMLRQLRQNLALCCDLRSELEQLWRTARPDIVIADFTLPFAGHLAQDLGARWWTTTTSPSARSRASCGPSCSGWVCTGSTGMTARRSSIQPSVSSRSAHASSSCHAATGRARWSSSVQSSPALLGRVRSASPRSRTGGCTCSSLWGRISGGRSAGRRSSRCEPSAPCLNGASTTPAGVPLVVWPHDYDQFDHAVRIEALGAGRRLRPRSVALDLLAVHEEPRYRANARKLQAALMGYDPVSAVEARLVAACETMQDEPPRTGPRIER